MSEPEIHPHDPRWRRLPEERPRQILLAAIEVFGEYGIAGAKLEEIATHAGVSKGTIYLYFQSKEELFREVVRQLLVPAIAELEREVTGGNAADQIERYLRVHWARFERPGTAGWVRLVLTELPKYPDLAAFYFDEAIAKSNHVLGDILRRGVASGEFRTIEPVVAISMIKAILLTHVLWSEAPMPETLSAVRPRADRIDDIVDFVLHALRPCAPSHAAL
ncbi:MAG: TetR/AcrR family transcriptional regulator [Gemmatimonadetes bacterium]|nr:TetR/AcrR family transcriptional regulator [Gemmatimonadota bacterium]